MFPAATDLLRFARLCAAGRGLQIRRNETWSMENEEMTNGTMSGKKWRWTALLAGTALALTASFGAPGRAQEQGGAGTDQTQQQTETREQVSGEVGAAAKTGLEEKRKALLQEAIDALEATQEAVKALKDGDTKAALDKLAVVTGKLQIVTARDPELALAPVAVDYIVYDTLADVQTVRDLGNRIEDHVQDGEFQKARKLLSAFASELVISTTNLPLATYPDAILEATRLIDEGKTDEALNVLDTALATLVVTERVIALPPLRAQAMLEKARALLDKGDATTKDDAGLTASDYVASARTELELAEALGYGTRDDFRDLYDMLDDLEEAIDNATPSSGIFDRIDDGFVKLKKRLFGAEESVKN